MPEAPFNPYNAFSQQRRRAPYPRNDDGSPRGPGMSGPGSPISYGAPPSPFNSPALSGQMNAPGPAPLPWTDQPEQRQNFANSLDRTRQNNAIASGKAATFNANKVGGMTDRDARRSAQIYSDSANATVGGAPGFPSAPYSYSNATNAGSHPFVAAPSGPWSGMNSRSAPVLSGRNINYGAPVSFSPHEIQAQESTHKTAVAEAWRNYSTLQKNKFADPDELEKAKNAYDGAVSNQSNFNVMRGSNPGTQYFSPTPTGAPPMPLPGQISGQAGRAPGVGVAAPGTAGADKHGIELDPATAQSMWHGMVRNGGNVPIAQLRDQFAAKLGEYGHSPETAHGLLDQWQNDGSLIPSAPMPATPNWTPTVPAENGHGGIYQDPSGQRIVVGQNGQRVGAPLPSAPSFPNSPTAPSMTSAAPGAPSYRGGPNPAQSRMPIPRATTQPASTQPTTQPSTQPAVAAQPAQQPRLKTPQGGSENGDGTITLNGSVYAPTQINGQWNWKKQ